MIDFAARLRWTVWAALGVVLGALYGPFAVGDSNVYASPGLTLFAFFTLVGVWLVAGVLLVAGSLGRRSSLALIFACAACLVAVTVNLPAQLQTDGVNWGFGSFGWFLVLLALDRPLRVVGPFLALPAVLSLAVVAASSVASVEAVSAVFVRALVVAGPQLVVAFASAQLQLNAEKAADAAQRQRRVRSANSVAAALDSDRQRRMQVVREAIEPVLRELSSVGTRPLDEDLRRGCLVAAARVRRLLAESNAGDDPLVHELSASLDALQRRGLVVELAVRGPADGDIPVEQRRGLTDPLLDVVVRAASRVRVTLTRGPDEVRLAVVADVHDGADDLCSVTTGDMREGVEVSAGHVGGVSWLRTRWVR